MYLRAHSGWPWGTSTTLRQYGADFAKAHRRKQWCGDGNSALAPSVISKRSK